jgi:hypothetical protein
MGEKKILKKETKKKKKGQRGIKKTQKIEIKRSLYQSQSKSLNHRFMLRINQILRKFKTQQFRQILTKIKTSRLSSFGKIME